MSDSTAVAEVLERAADTLFICGRTTGAAINAKGEMCVRGAIAFACGLDVRQPNSTFAVFFHPVTDAIRTLEGYLAAHPDVIRAEVADAHREWVDRGSFPSWVWNDTTHGPEGDELVIDTLRRCAKEIRNNPSTVLATLPPASPMVGE